MSDSRKIVREPIAAGNETPAAESNTVRRVMRRYLSVWLAYSFASGFLFGVYPIFLRSRGLDQFEMNSVLATYFAVTFLTDVPTGAFADALGRRRSFMLGCALRTVAFLVYFFAHSYLAFLLGESIDGIGTTFCNGAIDAWGVDELDAAGYPGAKDRLFSRIMQLTNVGFMASAVIGAYVADVNIAWPWLLGAVGYFGCAITGAALMRDRPRPGARVDLGALADRIARRVGDGLREGFRRRSVLMLSLANGIFFAAWAPYWLQWPQFFTDSFGAGVWVVGWIFALFSIAKMAGAETVIRVGGDEDRRANRIVALIGVCAVLLFAGGSAGQRPLLVMGLLFMMNCCIGAAMPMAQSWLNEQIGADERATLLSFNSTFATIGGSIGLLLSGLIADHAGIQVAWRFSALLSLAAAPCYLAIRGRSRAESATGVAG
jgi:MFS family permease